MKRYYIFDHTVHNGFEEVEESELYALLGTEEVRPYASQVYHGELSISEVPEELKESVETVVANKIARWGEYQKQEISASDLQTMIEEVL